MISKTNIDAGLGILQKYEYPPYYYEHEIPKVLLNEIRVHGTYYMYTGVSWRETSPEDRTILSYLGWKANILSYWGFEI